MQGAGFALINILEGVKRLGINPIVLIPKEGPMSVKLRELGINYYFINTKNCIYPPTRTFNDVIRWPYRLIKNFVINLNALINLIIICKKEVPDVIHTNSGVIRYGFWCGMLLGIPHVWHIREYQSKDFFWRALGGEKRVAQLYSKSSNHCIAITRGIFSHFGLDMKKDKVIYDGVFHENVSLPNVKKKKYFLFVGSLQKGKGIFDAIQAFETVAHKLNGYELWIAGHDYIGVESYISSMKNKKLVKYLGFRPDVYEMIAGATALLVPSYYEGFGFITAESMLNNTLVIGRDVAGTKEQLDNGLNITGNEIGLRFNDLEGLCNAMIAVTKNGNEHYTSMIHQAHDVVMSMYTIENSSIQVVNFYNIIIQKENNKK